MKMECFSLEEDGVLCFAMVLRTKEMTEVDEGERSTDERVEG